MTSAALAFAAGVIALQQQAALPSLAWASLLLPLGLVLLKRPRLAPVFTLALGFLWAAACAQARIGAWLAPQLEGRDIALIGVVAGLPTQGERSVRFDFDVESAGVGPLPGRILLSWYDTREPVHPGERWSFTVRLRRPHGLANPHGFDYEAWLLERGIGATGYVRESERLGRRDSVLDRVEQAREAIRDRFAAGLGAQPAAGILAALAVGDQNAISNEEWQLFSRTGVTHLMSISGLHVTLISGLLAWLVSALWRRVPALTLKLPARKAAALAAIAGALAYTLLAGFGVPAQRTFYMVSIVAAALWSGRIASPARTLVLALAAVLIVDPWAPLAPGFWLSFGAVALIFYVAAGWTGREGWLAQWARVQWAITLGLAPAALLFFGQISLAGPLANAVAIPLVSVVITPLALIAALLPLDFLLEASAWLVDALLQFLEWCASLPGALWQQHSPAAWSIALAIAGVAWLLAPRGVPGRFCAAALMAPAFALPPPAPRAGEAWITTFDVGQGLAVLVRTATRTLVYDTGPSYGGEADGGGRVVLPQLRAEGIGALDLLVLTHEDSDHVGGALTVLESLPVLRIASSLPGEHPLHALAPSVGRCAAGERWEWDEVRFEFLHPQAGTSPPERRNDESCVLRIITRGGSMLLTGDIERAAEARLARGAIRSDVLLVPHHGSRTSSTEAFITAVAPRWAVIPVGYRNRFRHPNAQVLERYRAARIEVLRTDLQGAVRVVLGSGETEVQAQRARDPRYWRAAPGI